MSTVASGGVVKPYEVLKRTLNLYEGNTAENTRGLKGEDYQTIMNNMGALSHSVDVTNLDDEAINTTSVTATPMSRLIYDGNEYAVDIALTKGPSQQFSNDVGSPVQGTVVFVGTDDRHGNYVIIRANSGTDFNQKGDLIKISNLASISVKEGDNLGRGVLIGLQGDDSALNSTEGSSTTGSDIEAGHINIQVLQPGENVNPNNDSQYSQAYQNRFVKGSFLSLYTGNTTNNGDGPVTYINPSDFKTIVTKTSVQPPRDSRGFSNYKWDNRGFWINTWDGMPYLPDDVPYKIEYEDDGFTIKKVIYNYSPPNEEFPKG
tara:strand:+ start:23 stop:976 length:954 start_codon:yes stop_codon:yes gene_type:complete